MTDHVADALVLMFTYGVSLRTWVDTGGISRELALYERLSRYYPRIILVTYGGPGDRELLEQHAPGGCFELVCNERRAPLQEFAGTIPGLVSAALGPAKRVVVKTNQMNGGEVAVAVVRVLRAHGRDVGLVARGGYPWSRMMAHEYGPDSPQALDAGEKESELCAAADIVVGTTPAMIEDLAWRYGLPPARTALIPNYVVVGDEPVPAPSDRTPGLLLYAGQLVPRKRVDILIRAVAALDERERASLEIVGDGPELPVLQSLAEQLGVNARFVGRLPHDRLLERMSSCGVYVQASEMEGHPKTVLEAMAVGAPVLIANTPGLGETVVHGVNGLRIPNTVEAFSQAIDELLGDPEWRGMLGTAAARSARSALGLDTIVPREVAAHRAALAHAGAHLALRRSA